jgi:hypothetical protein
METTTYSDVADYVWLTGDEAAAMLFELAGDNRPLHTLVSQLRRQVSAQRAHLVLEQLELRRRAAAKFAHPERMFFTRTGLEQATDEWVAAYKTQRFALKLAGLLGTRRGGPSSATCAIADLCCGIGGDLMALANVCRAVGVERDPRTAHFASVNSGAEVVASDVEQFDRQCVTALHIDPDRRAAGHRTTSIDAFQPGLATLESFLARVPNAAVKLAPATRVPDDWSQRCELEWISRDRECRQLVAWHGALADFPGQRRATLLTTAGGLAARTVKGRPNRSIPIASTIDRYVFDVNAAVRAARLTGVLALQHALSALTMGPTYLTSPRPIDDPLLACFEVQDVFPFEPRKLARHLAERAIGTLEVKKRGVDVDPEKLRRELKLGGDNRAALLITRAGESVIAILARRIR